MCRMIAKVSSSESSIIEEMFLCPTSLHYLSANGKLPNAPWERGEHNDGCGLAFVQDGNIEIHKRDKEHAWDDSYQAIVRDIRSRFFIAHNRLASKGLNTSIESAHPFLYMPRSIPYAFSHNGTIRSYMDEAVRLGTSDSSVLLRKIVDAKEKNPGREVSDIVTSIAMETDYNSMSAFLLTPTEMMVWRIYNDANPDTSKTYEDAFTLYFSLRNGNAMVSSEPLDEGNWHSLPNKTYLLLKPSEQGVIVDYKQLSI